MSSSSCTTLPSVNGWPTFTSTALRASSSIATVGAVSVRAEREGARALETQPVTHALRVRSAPHHCAAHRLHIRLTFYCNSSRIVASLRDTDVDSEALPQPRDRLAPRPNNPSKLGWKHRVRPGDRFLRWPIHRRGCSLVPRRKLCRSARYPFVPRSDFARFTRTLERRDVMTAIVDRDGMQLRS